MSKYAPHSRSQPRASPYTKCQKCLGTGHFTYECKAARPYVSRPSRTQQLENPRVLAQLKKDGKPSVEVPDEFKSKSGTANRILEAKEQARTEEKDKEAVPLGKRKRSTSASSESSDSTSESESESESDWEKKVGSDYSSASCTTKSGSNSD